MRPGSRWNGEAANPIVAAIYGAVVSLLLCYALSYLFTCLRLGIVSAHVSWDSRHAFMLAGLNVYACQHIPLIGSGVPPGDEQHIRAFITLPLTLWAAIPVFALIAGGWVCARTRVDAGRWGMTASALMGGIIYAGVLTGLAGVVSAEFASTAIPVVRAGSQEWGLSPPEIPFMPTVVGTLVYSLLFGLAFSYLGALLAVRIGAEIHVRGKWWSCAKAVVIVALLLQLLMCGAMLGWFAAQSRSSKADQFAQPEIIAILPTAAGAGYALLHGAEFTARATPLLMPDAAYGVQLGLYRGVETIGGGKISSRPASPYAWIGGLIGGIAVLLSGGLAVRLGSRDGSLPTAMRVTVLQSAYLAVTMVLCRVAWGVTGQSSVVIGPAYDSGMLVEVACVFIIALAGAHWATRKYAGRLAGSPSA